MQMSTISGVLEAMSDADEEDDAANFVEALQTAWSPREVAERIHLLFYTLALLDVIFCNRICWSLLGILVD